MSQRARIIAFMIFKIICFAVCLLFFVGGLIVFLSFKESGEFGQGLIGWIVWGAFALFSLPVDFLKTVISGAREGAVIGANTYKITDYGSGFLVTNSVGSGTLQGIVIGIIAFLLVGPILLCFKTIGNLITVISCILALRRISN